MTLTCYVTDKKIGSEKEREWEEVPRTSLLVNADLASLDSPSAKSHYSSPCVYHSGLE